MQLYAKGSLPLTNTRKVQSDFEERKARNNFSVLKTYERGNLREKMDL